MLQDLRHSLRLLISRPAFAALVVLALAAGIGVNVALFSVVDGLLLAPLPYERADRLVEIERPGVQLDDLRGAASFSSVGGWLSAGFPVGVPGESHNVFGMRVSPGLFQLLGVRPFRGRLFHESEAGHRIAILSYQYARANPVDRLILANEPYDVVGVLPENFVLGVRDGSIFVPARMTPGRVVARLSTGATVAQAQAEAEALLPGPRPPRVRSLNDAFRAGDPTTILFLQAAVGFVLLITCANIGNLVLVAAQGRRKEFAIRAAIGAARWQILRRLFVENLLLGVAGATLGLAISAASLAWIEKQLPGNLTRMLRNPNGLVVDSRILLFTAAIATLAVLLFGLAPALSAFRLDLMGTLRGASPGRARSGAVLVAVEAALSLILLIGAGLTIKSLLGLQKRDLGFRPEHVMRAGVDLLPARYPRARQRAAAFEQIAQRIAALPGVEAVGVCAPQLFPFGGPRASAPVFDRDHPDDPRVGVYVASPGYLPAIRLPLLRGRWFTDRDDLASDPVSVVGDLVVKQYFHGADPVGRRIRLQGVSTTVVGVVGDVRNPVGADWQPMAYRPFAQAPTPMGAIYLRAAGDSTALVEPLRRVVRDFDPTAPTFAIVNLERSVWDYLSGQRFTASLLSFFAAMGLLLATLGVHAVMRHWVASNAREVGIRVALGADARSVTRLVLGRAAKALGVGLAAGVGGSIALQRVIVSELHDVSPVDPAVILLVLALLAAGGLLAAAGPARRACGVDPLAVLKQE